ncbi:6-phosphofructokinase, partial [Rhodopirellula bahusiensis]
MAELAHHNLDIKRVAILFAGGPAPAANAVISTAAFSFLEEGAQVFGIKHGYSRLAEYTAAGPLQEGADYIRFTHDSLTHARSSRGIMIGTARTNPGKHVSSPEHLKDPELVAPLRRVYEGLCSLEVDALISIGGDDTLKTANKLKMFQDNLPGDARRFPVVHLPKTIDNDYSGIDFTFGFFTAVETLAEEIRNLNYDAAAGRAYFLCEAMGRSAGWLAYGAAIAGEASMVLSVEDITGALADEEVVNQDTGETRKIMAMERV